MWTLDEYFEEVVAQLDNGYPFPPKEEVEKFLEEGYSPTSTALAWMDYIDQQ